MPDWDVIAKQRLTEDWATLRAAYLPLNQAMRRTVEFLEKGDTSFSDLLVVVRERLDGTLKNLTALCNRRSPWVRLEAIRNLRVMASGLHGAANDDPRALLRYLFALSELLTNVWKDAPSEARVSENLVLKGEPEFWFGCECCAVGVLEPARPDDPPDLTRATSSRTTWRASASRCRPPPRPPRPNPWACRSWMCPPRPSAAARNCSVARVAGCLAPSTSNSLT